MRVLAINVDVMCHPVMASSNDIKGDGVCSALSAVMEELSMIQTRKL